MLHYFQSTQIRLKTYNTLQKNQRKCFTDIFGAIFAKVHLFALSFVCEYFLSVPKVDVPWSVSTCGLPLPFQVPCFVAKHLKSHNLQCFIRSLDYTQGPSRLRFPSHIIRTSNFSTNLGLSECLSKAPLMSKFFIFLKLVVIFEVRFVHFLKAYSHLCNLPILQKRKTQNCCHFLCKKGEELISHLSRSS